MRWLAVMGLVALLSTGRSAQAAGGELSLRGVVGNEVGVLYHPLADYTQTHGSAVYIPRFGALLTYGVAHWLELGIGADVSLPRAVVAQKVAFQEIPQGNLYADYLDLFIPVQLTLRYGVGTDYNWLVVLSAGPAFVRWDDRSMLVDDSPGSPRYPLRQGASWYRQWFSRVAVLFEWRPTHWAALQVGPYGAYTSGGDAHGGLLVQGDLSFGFGPSF